MQVLKWLSALTLAAFAASSDTDVPELVIDKTYVPTDCSVKSQKGDKISVHYVSRRRRRRSRLFSTRSPTDSRRISRPGSLPTAKCLTRGTRVGSFLRDSPLISPTRTQPYPWGTIAAHPCVITHTLLGINISYDRVGSRRRPSHSRLGRRVAWHVPQRETDSHHSFEQGIRCARCDRDNMHTPSDVHPKSQVLVGLVKSSHPTLLSSSTSSLSG